jgi:hypothetical protein
MKLCLFFTITLIICQYFISQLTIEARPAALKKFSWSIPIHDDYQDDTNEQPVKRKGVGMSDYFFCSFLQSHLF